MPLIIELTAKEKTLNNILRSIVTNIDSVSLPKPTIDLIAKDLMRYKPKSLVHCYDTRELIKIDKMFRASDCNLEVCREVIPNNHNLGLIRESDINPRDTLTLEQIFSKYRYYLIYKETKHNIFFVITYNPEIRTKRQVNVRLSNELIAHCHCMQTDNFTKRDIEKLKETEEDIGTYTVYKM